MCSASKRGSTRKSMRADHRIRPRRRTYASQSARLGATHFTSSAVLGGIRQVPRRYSASSSVLGGTRGFRRPRVKRTVGCVVFRALLHSSLRSNRTRKNANRLSGEDGRGKSASTQYATIVKDNEAQRAASDASKIYGLSALSRTTRCTHAEDVDFVDDPDVPPLE